MWKALYLLVLATFLTEHEFAAAYVRPGPSGTLPLHHLRLRSQLQDSAWGVEQVHVTFASSHYVTVNYVTQRPRHSNRLSSLLALQQGQLALGSEQDCLDSSGQSVGGVQSSSVQWGTRSGVYTSTAVGRFTCYSAEGYDSDLLHGVILGPLLPSMTYFYKPAGAEQEYSFTTPPTQQSAKTFPFRIAVFGDLGQTDTSLDTLEHIQDSQAGAIINCGDLSYADGDQPRWDSWGRLVEPLFSSVLSAVVEGNHEIEQYSSVSLRPNLTSTIKSSRSSSSSSKSSSSAASGSSGQNARSSRRDDDDDADSLNEIDLSFVAYETRLFAPLDRRSVRPSPLFHSHDVAGAHVVMLGSYAPFWEDSEQYQWLLRDLAAVDRRVTPWVIVAFHAPWYNSNVAHQGEGDEMRDVMEEVLYEHGVDFVFSGHVHAYERSHRVYKGEVDCCGPHHIVVGDGGNREGLATDYLDPQPEWSAFREASFGHGTLDLVNATYAHWRWVRNQDSEPVAADSHWVVRRERCSASAVASTRVLDRENASGESVGSPADEGAGLLSVDRRVRGKAMARKVLKRAVQQ